MNARPLHSATMNRLPKIVHAALLLLTLGLAIGWPRAGQAALLLPLDPSRSNEALEWLMDKGATIEGPARVGGGLVIRLANDDTAFAALQRGWLLIAVPAAACNLGNLASATRPPSGVENHE